MTLDFSTTEHTVTITDQIERTMVEVRADGPLTPTDAATDFTYPVDEAISITASRLTITRPTVVVLDEDGTSLAALTGDDTDRFDPGTYSLQVADDLKAYLRFTVTTAFEIQTTADSHTISFAEPTSVDVGARSTVDHPTATITTTSAPADLMAALSTFGAALTDTGPMRSFASLRGHPPTIELGDELDIPDALTPPSTGITIVVPPQYDYLFPAATLAYYLGATIEPGADPRIETDTGFRFGLTGHSGYEERVARVLKQVLTLDTFVRSAGPYGCALDAAPDIAAATDLDPETVYDRPPAERLETYLSVPWSAVEPFVPDWSSTAYVEFTADRIPYLPFLVDDLAIIRTPETAETRTISSATASGDEFTRASATMQPTSTSVPQPAPFSDPEFLETLPDDALEQHTADGRGSRPTATPVDAGLPDAWSGEQPTAFVPESTRAQETLWLADGIPIGATKPTLEAYQHGLERDPVDEIEVLVVCNDPRMAAEDEAVRRLLNADTNFDVCVRPFRGLHTDELEELLHRGADFLHYIGHIDDAGFVCPDGHLDASTLDSVNVDACFLNACASYEQGRALVDAGAIASIVTLTDVLNSAAVGVGTTMARLLNAGFPLGAGLSLAAAQHVIDDYTIIGDGGIQITENPQGATYVEAETLGEDVWLQVRSHACPQAPLGSMFSPLIPGIDGWYLNGIDAVGDVSIDEFAAYLADADHPVRVDGQFGWSCDWRP